MIDKSESLKHYKNTSADLEKIYKLHSDGKSIEDIALKVRVGISYVEMCLKKGKEQMLKEWKKGYGLTDEDFVIVKTLSDKLTELPDTNIKERSSPNKDKELLAYARKQLGMK